MSSDTGTLALVPKEYDETATPASWTIEQTDLIKRTVAKGTTDDELALFLYVCKRTGLDPLARQIYAVKRGGQMVIQTGIDGYRLTAARTRAHAGTDDAIFDSEDEDYPNKATTTVYRFVQGQRVPYTATARWSEYCQENGPGWKRMPYLMLAKCSEALALRKAFPAELSGLYTHEEMLQAETAPPALVEQPQGTVGRISDGQRRRLFALCKEHGVSHEDFKRFLKDAYQLDSTNDIEAGAYNVICQGITDGSVKEFLRPSEEQGK